MGGLLLTHHQRIDLPMGEVFALIGTRPEAGWLFGAEFTALAPGALVRFGLPLDPARPDADVLETTGRIAAVQPPRRLVIEHQLPWPGRISCTLTPLPDGRATTVRLVVEVAEEALTWLLRRRGYDPPPEEDGGRSLRIGLLTSQSGPASLYAGATGNLAEMAVAEINADGGVDGRPVRLMVRDDATDPRIGAEQLRRLARIDGCRVVVTNVISATFEALRRDAERLGVLLVYATPNEGGPRGEGVVRLGERPLDQLGLGVPHLLRSTGARRCFLVGSDYVWPRTSNRVARAVVERCGASVVGERYLPLGTREFDRLIEEIARSGADLVVSSFIGLDEAAFERAAHAAGLRARCVTFSLALDEATREYAGAAAADGLWSAFGYFQQLPAAGNRALLDRYRRRYGPAAPPLSSMTESVYGTIHALRTLRVLSADHPVRDSLAALRTHGLRLREHMYLAESVGDSFRILGGGG